MQDDQGMRRRFRRLGVDGIAPPYSGGIGERTDGDYGGPSDFPGYYNNPNNGGGVAGGGGGLGFGPPPGSPRLGPKPSAWSRPLPEGQDQPPAAGGPWGGYQSQADFIRGEWAKGYESPADVGYWLGAMNRSNPTDTDYWSKRLQGYMAGGQDVATRGAYAGQDYGTLEQQHGGGGGGLNLGWLLQMLASRMSGGAGGTMAPVPQTPIVNLEELLSRAVRGY